ncbi:MAG: hypothetical protein AB8E74_00475 [Prochlorococcus sp.]|nr:hypothetical protein [Prochlorococcaceae cyanobacterium Fu_MAG_50]
MERSFSATWTSRSPLTIAAGFLGAFIIASLGVQLVRTETAVTASPQTQQAVEPVTAHQASLWSALGER